MLVFVSFFKNIIYIFILHGEVLVIVYSLFVILVIHDIHVLYKGDKSDVQTQSLLVNT